MIRPRATGMHRVGSTVEQHSGLTGAPEYAWTRPGAENPQYTSQGWGSSMQWYEYILPTVAIAALVRIEALFMGPYWAWVELLPYLPDESDSRERRVALVRRVAIPGLILFALVAVWQGTYSQWAALVIGASAGGLLLWPAVVNGLPGGLRSRDSELVGLYSALIVSFASSAWAGAILSEWITGEYGSVLGFLREELVSFLFALVVTAFASGVFGKLSSLLSTRVNE